MDVNPNIPVCFQHNLLLLLIWQKNSGEVVRLHQELTCPNQAVQYTSNVTFYNLQVGIRTLKVLQLTDIHVDMRYVENSMNDCENGKLVKI